MRLKAAVKGLWGPGTSNASPARHARLDLKTLKARVRGCGYHCGGELTPRHVCAPEDPPAVATAPAPMARHAAPEVAAHAGHAEPSARAGEMDSTTHEMGHGAGMDMQAMARDMRNRFWICLTFSVPIFVYSPMGGTFTPPAPPFGLPLALWLFVLASGAVLYPGWPFVVAAWRAVNNGVLNMAVLVAAPAQRRADRRGVRPPGHGLAGPLRGPTDA